MPHPLHEATTHIVPSMRAQVFAGGSAGTFAVAAIGADDRILWVHSSSSISAMPVIPIVGEGDAFRVRRSASSASVVGAGVIGLDYSTVSFFNTVIFIDTDTALS